MSRTTKAIKRLLIKPLDKVVPLTSTTTIVVEDEVVVAIKEVEEMLITLSLNVNCVVSVDTLFNIATTCLTSPFKYQILPATVRLNLRCQPWLPVLEQ